MDNTRHKVNRATTFLAAALLLLLAAAVLAPPETRAQWTQPDSNNNISTTNSGNVGVGTTTPNQKLAVEGPVAVRPSNAKYFTPSAPLHVFGGSIASRANSAVQEILTLSQSNTQTGGGGYQSKGSHFSIGLSFWEDPGNNSPRTRVDFRTTGRTNDWESTPNTVMSLRDDGNVGIGTTTPGSLFDVAGNGRFYKSGDNAVVNVFSHSNTAWFRPLFSLARSRGAFGAPAAVTTNDLLGSFSLSGYDGTTYQTTGQVEGYVDGAVSPGVVPVRISFTTGTTEANRSEKMTIRSDGRVGIGTVNPAAKLHVSGGARVEGAGRVYVGTGAVLGARGLEFVEESATTFSIRHHDPNVAWQHIAINPHGGNVGVGTATPSVKLDVNGAANISGNLNVTGNVTGNYIEAKYQDVAEWVPTTQRLAAGTVVVLDAGRTNHVLASGREYDTSVAGVVSARPGLILGEGGEGKVMVATTGRVKVRVDATKSPVRVGDLLVTSGAGGVAMKSVPVELGGVAIHRPGTIIGKALEPLAGGVGEILVLLSLQ